MIQSAFAAWTRLAPEINRTGVDCRSAAFTEPRGAMQ